MRWGEVFEVWLYLERKVSGIWGRFMWDIEGRKKARKQGRKERKKRW